MQPPRQVFQTVKPPTKPEMVHKRVLSLVRFMRIHKGPMRAARPTTIINALMFASVFASMSRRIVFDETIFR